jgi:adenosylhomocysteinase
MEILLEYFKLYPENKAPFLHKQLALWQRTQPLANLEVLHHVPVVLNTMLKIACLIAAGAKVVVTNPSFLSAHPKAVHSLQEADIPYVEEIASLQGRIFDLYFDCGAELYQNLGAPRLGAIELTATGDTYYRQQALSFPVVSIDPTYTKQLETVFGSAESASQSIAQLTHLNLVEKSWMIYGFGKIGRGLVYYCITHGAPVVVVDIDENARNEAQALGVKAINPNDKEQFQSVLLKTDIIVTATGRSNIFRDCPKKWFAGKIMANMGMLDEFGPQFSENEVLNKKRPVNFILDDPTPIRYIDPELYAHNLASLELLNNNLSFGVHTLSPKTDQEIITSWCQHQNLSLEQVTSWFEHRKLAYSPYLMSE